MKYKAILYRRNRSTGVVTVRIQTPRGGQWLSTGQTNYRRAKQVCTDAMLEELHMAACAKSLNAEAISRLTTGRRFTSQDILEAWKEEAIVDLSPDTFDNYLRTLNHWLAATKCGNQPLVTVYRRMLNAYVNEPKVAAGTRKGRLNALKSYYGFASSAGYCIGNLAERIRVRMTDLMFPEMESKPYVPFTEAEVMTLLASPKVTPPWRWIIAFGWYFGFRIRDCACLEWDSIQETTVTIFQKKTANRPGGGRLQLPIDDPLFGGGAVRRYVLEMLEAERQNSKFCFPKLREDVLQPHRNHFLSMAFTRILEKHGMKGKSFHGLRHSFALRLQAMGMTTKEVSRSMGHRGIEVTVQHYLNHPKTNEEKNTEEDYERSQGRVVS